jgi:hypothetical protein
MGVTIQTTQTTDVFQSRATPRGAVGVALATQSDSITTLSPALAAAVEAAPQIPPFFAATRAAGVRALLSQLGQVMAQGQGAYVVGYDGPGGGIEAAVSARDLARMANGSYIVATLAAPLSLTLRSALAQVAQALNPAPALSVTLTDPATADAQFALALLSKRPPPDPAAASHVAAATNPGVQSMDGGWEIQTADPTLGSTLAVVYVPPSDATTQVTQTLSTSAPTASTIDLVA